MRLSWRKAAVVTFVAAGLAGGVAGPAAAAPASDVSILAAYWEGPISSESACWIRADFWRYQTGRSYTCVYSDGTHYGRGWWVYQL